MGFGVLYRLGNGIYAEQLPNGFALVKLCHSSTRELTRVESIEEAIRYYNELLQREWGQLERSDI